MAEREVGLGLVAEQPTVNSIEMAKLASVEPREEARSCWFLLPSHGFS